MTQECIGQSYVLQYILSKHEVVELVTLNRAISAILISDTPNLQFVISYQLEQHKI